MPAAKKSQSKAIAERAKKAVEKVKSASKSTSQSTAKSTTSKGLTQTSAGRELTVQGLSELTPNIVHESMPNFDPGSYSITDPLNPSPTLPRVTDDQFEKNKLIYKETQNALDSTGLAMDTAKKRFEVVGKQAKAIGAGIDTATAINEVKTKAVKYRTSEELLEQEFLKLDVATHRTTVATQTKNYDLAALDQEIEQARLRSEIASAKSDKLQTDLEKLTNGLSLAPAQ